MKVWLLPAFLAFVLWGIWGFIPKLTTQYISPTSAIIFEVVGGMIVGILVLFLVGFKPEIHPKGIGLAVSTGILGLLGALCYLIAVSKGKVSVVVTVTALYPIVSIGLAYVILKEPISLKEGLGIILAFIAIMLFSV
nr:hypothetical protein [Desulfobacterales bacterium]